MENPEINKPILTLLILIVVEIMWSGVYALTGTWQQRTFLLTCQVVPLLVALSGLWKFKYWAWVVAVIVVVYNLTGLFTVIPNWSTHIAYYQRFNTNLIRVAYMLVVNYVINLNILILLVTERDYFNE
jgi:hypothetical protein